MVAMVIMWSTERRGQNMLAKPLGIASNRHAVFHHFLLSGNKQAYYLLCVCACVYTFAREHACTQTYVYACIHMQVGGQRVHTGCPSPLFSTLLFEIWSLTEPGTHQLS